jgi:hypothetical protein
VPPRNPEIRKRTGMFQRVSESKKDGHQPDATVAGTNIRECCTTTQNTAAIRR